jgi:hypothetical protein
MPYCGRCLNVGRAGKRGVPQEYGSVQPRQRCATSSGSTDSEPGHSMRFAGSRRPWTSHRVNTWTRILTGKSADPIQVPKLVLGQCVSSTAARVS